MRACCFAHAPGRSRWLRAGGYEGSATRASVNDLAGLAAVGDKVGVYGVVTTRTDALYAPLTSEWNGTPLMDNVRTTGIDAATGMLFWNGDYTYPLEENRRVKFCVCACGHGWG